MQYSAYGLVLSSSIRLPDLPKAAAGEPALRVRSRTRPLVDRGWTWFQARPKRTKGTWVAVASRGAEYRLIFDGGAEFLVCPGDRSIVAITARAASPAAVRHRLVDQVVPLAMSHFGRVILHASALSTPFGAVAFVGAAGAGKSTLASHFALAGTPVVADDALFLERAGGHWLAVPAYPGVRVAGDRGAAKERLTGQHGVAFASRKGRLRRVYVLRESARANDPIRIERLSPRESIMTIVEYAFVLDTEDRGRMAAHFARVSAAASSLDIRALVYPRKAAALPRVRDAVLSDLFSRG